MNFGKLLAFLLLVGCSTIVVRHGDPRVPILNELASPQYEGRGVGTKGLERARDYLVAELKRYAFVGAFANHAYTQDFRVFIGNELQSGNSFAGSTNSDFLPFAFSHTGKISNTELVFVGFGITVRGKDKSFLYDDYAGIDVKGKIVVAMLGDPAVGAKSSLFRNSLYYQFSTPIYKAENAEHHGATGIVLVRDPLSLPADGETQLKFQSRQGGGSSLDILAGQARIAFIEKLVGQDLKKIQLEMSAKQKPHSFSIQKKVDLSIALEREVGLVQNISVLIPGNDADLEKEYIVIGAHYDHLGLGGDSSLDPNAVGKIHPGADDNASGVQAIFDIAGKIRDQHLNRRPVLIVFFSAEEIGLLGSKNFLEMLALPTDASVVGMLNLDMVGRFSDNKLTVLGEHSAVEFDDLLNSVNKEYGFNLVRGDDGFGSSDHASFLLSKIPSLFFTTGAHVDYHRPSDTIDKINVDGLKHVEEFIFDFWKKLDQLDDALEFDASSVDAGARPRSNRGYGLYFGSIPEFSTEQVEGVKIRGTRPGSPAEAAGMKPGDILIGLGDTTIKNIYDFVYALRFYRANEEVQVIWLRSGVRMQSKTKLLSRDAQ